MQHLVFVLWVVGFSMATSFSQWVWYGSSKRQFQENEDRKTLESAEFIADIILMALCIWIACNLW